MFDPIVSLICVLLVFFACAFAIACRLVRWEFNGVKGTYYCYLGLSVIVGIGFALLPNIVINRGMGWWWDSAQPNVFFGLLIWLVFSVFSTFFAGKRYLVVPLCSVLFIIVDLVAFLIMGEAGDIRTLSPQFFLMRVSGATLATLALVSCWHTSRGRSGQPAPTLRQ